MSSCFREIFSHASDPLDDKLNLWLGLKLVQQFLAIDGVERIVQLRDELQNDGYALPRVHIRDRATLHEDGYEIEFESTALAFGRSTTFEEVLADLGDIARTHGILHECLQG